ncbi:MAG: antitoxin [Microbacteriaceae bacterium]|nr:antitoxin [Microbacteriaceae bacterium]
MSDSPKGPPARFPRRATGQSEERSALAPKVDDLDAFLDELDSIEGRIERVVARGQDAFSDGSDSYDHASMAIIRLAAIFEDDRFEAFLTPVPESARRGIATTRNLVAHHGYRAMDDERFWLTITVHVPDLLDRIRPSATERRS